MIARVRSKGGLSAAPHLWGYRAAAQILVGYLVDEEPETAGGEAVPFARDINYLVFPILQLYQHHSELYLKMLVRNALELNGKEPKWRNGHSLAKLWRELEGLLRQHGRIDDFSDFDGAAAECAQLFEELDSFGLAWRYPKDPSDRPYLKDRLSVHLSDLVKRLESVAFFLDLGIWEH